MPSQEFHESPTGDACITTLQMQPAMRHDELLDSKLQVLLGRFAAVRSGSPPPRYSLPQYIQFSIHRPWLS